MFNKKTLTYLLAFISLLAVFSFLSSPFFQLHQFAYQGLDRLNKGDIDKILQPFRQVNILLVDTQKVEKLLQENQAILAARVNKVFPDRLQIKIEERIPRARIINNGSYLVFTGDGYILDKGPLKIGEDVPEIKGVGYQLNQNRIEFTPAMAEIVQALGELNPENLAVISQVYFRDNELNLELKSRTRVFFASDENMTDSFEILDSIIMKMREENLLVDYIDLSIPEKPVIKIRNKGQQAKKTW